jgi:hypothetical protein
LPKEKCFAVENESTRSLQRQLTEATLKLNTLLRENEDLRCLDDECDGLREYAIQIKFSSMVFISFVERISQSCRYNWNQ